MHFAKAVNFKGDAWVYHNDLHASTSEDKISLHTKCMIVDTVTAEPVRIRGNSIFMLKDALEWLEGTSHDAGRWEVVVLQTLRKEYKPNPKHQDE